MITSVSQASLKVLLSLGVLLYFRNAQLVTLSPTDQPLLIDDQQVELDMKERRELLQRTCSKYGELLRVPLKLYNKRLRFDVEHNLMYCENYKDCNHFSPTLNTQFPPVLWRPRYSSGLK